MTNVLNCASDRLAISSSLSCIFSGALICFSFGPFFLSSRRCPVTLRMFYFLKNGKVENWKIKA